MKYVDGIAVHWYTDRWFPFPEALDIVHEEYPDKFILYSEACTGNQIIKLLGGRHMGEGVKDFVKIVLGLSNKSVMMAKGLSKLVFVVVTHGVA